MKPAEALDLLLAVAPAFPEPWLKHLTAWHREEAGLRLGLAEYAKFIVDLLESGQTEALPAIFAAIDRLLAAGDPAVQAATEDVLLVTLSNMRAYAEKMAPLWGPVARARCAAWSAGA